MLDLSYLEFEFKFKIFTACFPNNKLFFKEKKIVFKKCRSTCNNHFKDMAIININGI